MRSNIEAVIFNSWIWHLQLLPSWNLLLSLSSAIVQPLTGYLLYLFPHYPRRLNTPNLFQEYDCHPSFLDEIISPSVSHMLVVSSGS